MKKCSKCEKTFELNSFYKGKSSCIDCVKTYRKRYYADNKDKCTAAMKSYEAKNKEVILQKSRDKYKNNREIRLAYEKRYYQLNKSKILERERKYHNRVYKNNIYFRLKSRLRKRLYQAIKGEYKAGSAVKDLGCSIEELKKHLENQFQPGMTWENWTQKGWHIDHIIPLDCFNLQDPGELKKACHYSNLQPLWSTENLSKGATIHSSLT